MTFRQFAFNNVVRNKRIYLAHYLSSSFSVMIFFVYALLQYHPGLQGEIASTSETLSLLGTMGMKVSQYIIYIFSFFFCMYSVSAFLKTRKREFGILLMHGMSPKQLHRMVFIENVFIGAASTLTGVGAGLVFTKLILLAVSNVMAIQEGLRFIIPLKSIWVTMGAFALLFLVVSLFTSRMVKAGRLVDLFNSEEKPKPEPKASLVLSVFAVMCIGAGYGMVFYFSIERAFSFPLLVGGVGVVILGTYFLFTQLSVYVIGFLKRREGVFFKRTNVLTISELAYRMKDNATMFFMIAIVSAVAFTGIGTVLALGDPGLTAMEDPYAFTYDVPSDNPTKAEEDVKFIEQQLADNGFEYEKATLDYKMTDYGYNVIPLSQYNQVAKMRELEEIPLLADDQAIITPSLISQQTEWRKVEDWPSEVRLSDEQGGVFKLNKVVNEIILPYRGSVVVISDAAYDDLPSVHYLSSRVVFDVPNWKHTKAVARAVMDEINHYESDGNVTYSENYVSALVLKWISDKQENGLLFIVSSMVGIVFFTFAASFLYFRLYTDMERDQRQYGMIGKLGFTRRELKQVVTRQLALMFFLPIVMALIHSGVAFFCLQQLVNYSVLTNSVIIFVSFVTIQILYFLVIRWRYYQHMLQRMP